MMEDCFVDLGAVAAASGLGRYRYKTFPTQYGVLNIKVGDKTHAFDFSKDKKGQLSVNVRWARRDLRKEAISWRKDWKGFIIGKDGLCMRLKKSKSNSIEARRYKSKTEGWHTYALALRDYMEGLQ